MDDTIRKRLSRLGVTVGEPWANTGSRYLTRDGKPMGMASAGQACTLLALVEPLQQLADDLAGMVTEAEFGDDGMSGDDAVSTLSAMIEQARKLSSRRPDLSTPPTHPDPMDAHQEPIT